MKPLTHLYFHKYRIDLKPRELITLPPYKGSALRGLFGHAMKKVVCAVKGQECDGCLLRLKCIYSAIMESPIPEDHPHHRKYKNAPHPYIIAPPLTKRQYFLPDSLISFDIVLIGKANDYLPYFIYTFTEMGKIGIGKERGKFDVASVKALGLDGGAVEVFNGIDGILRAADKRIDYNRFIISPSSEPSPIITISFETPARIKEDNKLSSDIPFSLLIKRLSERALLLAHFHCGAEMGDVEGFIRDAENVESITNNLHWIDWERYSNRQQTKMKLGGLIGEITYKGDFQKYLPLLRLGEHIHVGKAATFGLGKYKIIKNKPLTLPSPLRGED
jgi:hypothetical protein